MIAVTQQVLLPVAARRLPQAAVLSTPRRRNTSFAANSGRAAPWEWVKWSYAPRRLDVPSDEGVVGAREVRHATLPDGPARRAPIVER